MECMDTLEARFITNALEFISKRTPETSKALEAQLARATSVAKMAASFPSLLDSPAGAVAGDSPHSLVQILCQVEPGMSSLNLPIKAVMGDAFLTAKIQVFQAFRKALLKQTDAPERLLEAANREVAQSLQTRLLAELLWDLVRDQEIPLDQRQVAAKELVRLWESPDTLEVDDFFPVIEAAWKARNRIKVTYGSLVGVTEFYQLIREHCPPMFVSYFTRNDVSEDENMAFQEFLFGLSHEDLSRLRKAMAEQGLNVIDRKFAQDTLKLSERAATGQSPEALYISYRKRQKATQLRRLTGLPGPRYTAEAYLILHLLEDALSFEDTIRL